jgi:endonuclease/exonuclease/phosphatase family metal-dependent hydrolase
MATLASDVSLKKSDARVPRRFQFVTWNVWFDSFEAEARWDALLTESLASKPAIVCFQEVTAEFHAQCIIHPAILAGGYKCAGLPRLHCGYDVAVWVAGGVDVLGTWTVRLPTKLGRRALIADVLLQDKSRIRVCTVHLESMKQNASRREAQLATLLPHLKRGDPFAYFKNLEEVHQRGKTSIRSSLQLAKKKLFDGGENTLSHEANAQVKANIPESESATPALPLALHGVILAGDFNLCGTWSENLMISTDNRLCDVWAHLHPDEVGWTEDTKINVMRFNIKRKHKQVRFDRVVLIKTGVDGSGGNHLPPSSQFVSPASIHLLGTDPLKGESGIFPSDHFGLLAEFIRF